MYQQTSSYKTSRLQNVLITKRPYYQTSRLPNVQLQNVHTSNYYKTSNVFLFSNTDNYDGFSPLKNLNFGPLIKISPIFKLKNLVTQTTFQITVFARGLITHSINWHIIWSTLVYMYYMYVLLYVCIICIYYMYWSSVFSANFRRYTAIGWKKDFSLEELTSTRWGLQVQWKTRRSEQNWVAERYLCLIYIITHTYIYKSTYPCLRLELWTSRSL